MARLAADSLSEEMRVLYVAMTRPQDRLIMTYAVKKVREHIEEMALRMTPDGNELLVLDVSCPGEWVLLAAVRRREGRELLENMELHGLCDTDRDYRWKMVIGQAPEALTGESRVEEAVQKLPAGAEERLKEALSFRYGHSAATKVPSKQTATQRKGRFKDDEAAEHTEEPRTVQRSWRKPTFMEQLHRGKDYGNAMHAVMQYIRYEACGSVDGVKQELVRLTQRGFLTEDQRKMVSAAKIAAFFATPIGSKLLDGTEYLREFKFSILDDGCRYDPALEGEQVLLQGVVDCALLEDDGITVLDFKTDYVTEETLEEVAARYRIQVDTYADALTRIYQKPVKASYLYFFRLGQFVKV